MWALMEAQLNTVILRLSGSCGKECRLPHDKNTPKLNGCATFLGLLTIAS